MGVDSPAEVAEAVVAGDASIFIKFLEIIIIMCYNEKKHNNY